MQQTTIYDFIGIDRDPIFMQIRSLPKGQELQLGQAIVRKNDFGFYELETKSEHESAEDMVDFYNKIIARNVTFHE